MRADIIGTSKTDFRAPRKPRLTQYMLDVVLSNALALATITLKGSERPREEDWRTYQRISRLVAFAGTRPVEVKAPFIGRDEWEALRLTLRTRAGGGAVHKAIVDALCRDVAREIVGAL